MKRLFLKALLMLLTLGSQPSLAAIADLSPYDSVQLDLTLKTYKTADGEPEIYYEVHTPYTNPVICSVDVAVPMTRNEHESVVEVSQDQVLIFPTGSFEKPLTYAVNLDRLPSDRELQIGIERTYQKAATCHGWPLGKRLPRKTCVQLNPQHETSCMQARTAKLNYYPVIRNDLHLGDCGC